MAIDLVVVKQRLRVEHDTDDDNLVALVAQANAIVADALTGTVVAVADAPIQDAMTIEIIRSLYDQPEQDPFTPAAKRLLNLLQGPALA